MAIVAFVPARGGSKGILDKNIIIVNDKPLIHWVLSAIEGCNSVEKVFVATDSNKIAEVANSFGFSKVDIFNRSEEGASDFSPTIDVVLEFINSGNVSEDDYLLLLQATSPLLVSGDVDSLVDGFFASGADSSLSCVESRKYHWTKNGESVGHIFSERKPRQQRKDALLVENGAMYLNKVSNIKNEKCLLSGKVFPFFMEYDSVYYIDSAFDLKIVEELMKSKFGV